MSRGRLVGTWSTTRGNSVDVFLTGGLDGAGELTCAWDTFPLSPEDQAEYVVRIRPAIIHHTRALLELRPGGSTLVLA